MKNLIREYFTDAIQLLVLLLAVVAIVSFLDHVISSMR